jgi:hypothetical protein
VGVAASSMAAEGYGSPCSAPLWWPACLWVWVQVTFGKHELLPPLPPPNMGGSSSKPVTVMLDPSLLQAYTPAYHNTPMYEATNSFASAELSLELKRERQCLEEEMQRLSTQVHRPAPAHICLPGEEAARAVLLSRGLRVQGLAVC